MTSGEQPVYEYRVTSALTGKTSIVSRKGAALRLATSDPSLKIERRQVGPWEKVEQ